MASSCIACCIFHIISIPFNCSDTALRITDAKIGPKVKMFVFRYVCFDLAPELVPRIFDLFSSRKPGWNFSYEPKAKFIPVTEPARSTGLIWRGPQWKKTVKNITSWHKTLSASAVKVTTFKMLHKFSAWTHLSSFDQSELKNWT